MDLRDVAGGFIFFGSFIASIIVEAACGAETERCALKWTVGDDVNVDSYHCAPHTENSGLPDPSLTVSSLMLVAVLPYLYIDDGRFNVLPIVGTFLGIASFLFHARPTKLYHRLDVTGCTLLAPALADAAAAAKSAADPVLDLGKPTGTLRLVALIPPVIVVSILHPTSPTWDPFWTVAIVYGFFFVWQLIRIYPRKSGSDILALDSIFYPLSFLLVGIITLLVGNTENFWSCVPSQFGEPHIWGHVFIAAGAVVVARKDSADDGKVDEVAESLLGPPVSRNERVWSLNLSAIGVLLCVPAAAVVSNNPTTAAIIVVVATGLHISGILCKPEGKPRYSENCPYWCIGIDIAAAVSLASGIASLAVEDAAAELAIVAVVAAFITTAFEFADLGKCY